MKCKEELEEEVDFWLGYISKWEARHNEPIPDRAQQLLNNALLERTTTPATSKPGYRKSQTAKATKLGSF